MPDRHRPICAGPKYPPWPQHCVGDDDCLVATEVDPELPNLRPWRESRRSVLHPTRRNLTHHERSDLAAVGAWRAARVCRPQLPTGARIVHGDAFDPTTTTHNADRAMITQLHTALERWRAPSQDQQKCREANGDRPPSRHPHGLPPCRATASSIAKRLFWRAVFSADGPFREITLVGARAIASLLSTRFCTACVECRARRSRNP
jgi:hypothetical protein